MWIAVVETHFFFYKASSSCTCILAIIMREWNCIIHIRIYIRINDNRVQQSIQKYFRDVCVVYMKYIHLTFSSSGNYIRRKKLSKKMATILLCGGARVRAVRCKCFLPKRELCHWRRSGAYVVQHTQKSISPLFQSVLTLSPGVDWFHSLVYSTKKRFFFLLLCMMESCHII